ncbi:helix-turn-helix domain-containing protein [Cytobacillus oceanisediminis]|uniref:helix-turn-helix domain-containing protein n=1 Tax=Cytobacillus oceanisediminis TaxID=665099 RepID=UPI001C2157A3|nr:helix-turn-helix transcriptional regulator [Cytobacillus oceanisediminis]MBU8773217.1 helix-turn-helix domain-containing protein [Cytobacillus oceanisediminis]
MKIGAELVKARKRQELTQQQLSFDLPVSRESLAKYETGTRNLPEDMRQLIAHSLDDVEFYFATWNDAAGEVSIPFFNGDYIDQHPASMVFLVQTETKEALDHLSKVSWVKPIHTRTEQEREEMKQTLFEILDAAASMINLVAVICREYRFSMKKLFKEWRLTLKARRMQQ